MIGAFLLLAALAAITRRGRGRPAYYEQAELPDSPARTNAYNIAFRLHKDDPGAPRRY